MPKSPSGPAPDLTEEYTPTVPAIREYQRKQYSFYRPHTHRGFENVDPDTGEVLPSMTRQSEMEACDIHNILKQYSQQGFEQLVRDNAARGQYADLTSLPDYQDSLNVVLNAQAAFAALPSQVRDRFLNDPSRFIEFLQDPANQDEAIRLGLAQDTRTPDPDPQRVILVETEPKTPPKGDPAK